MNIFQFLTPIIYWVLIVMWSYILFFLIRRLKVRHFERSLINTLIIILAINAFRTLFESIYFGVRFTSLLGFLPIGIYDFLNRPEMVFIPKFLTVIAATLIIFILLYRWFPDEERDREQMESTIKERTGKLKKRNEELRHEITERVQAEEEKRQLEMQLRQHQKLEAIGTLASGVAHEINNPIMGIMNYATLISERLDPSQSQLREFAKEIGSETERVAEIVRNLLTFSRQEKQSHSPARMIDIANDTLSLVRAVMRHDQITLEVAIPDDLPKIQCRSQQIQQVLMNLFTNARDALNERYLEYDPDKLIKLSVKIFEKNGRQWLRTTVEDHGAGIPAEIRERVFDPFYTTKDRATGTGLGLSISLGIIQDHHGELTFESEEGQPTRFYLDLPVDNGWDLQRE